MPNERIDKILSSQGLGSRREIARLAKAGEIQVNGTIITDAACKADPQRDIFLVSGRPVRYQKHLYIMMNKPQGVVSASRDPKQPTVLDLLPPAFRRRGLFPAGRLDRDTEGLLIITDDGDFAHRLLSPKKGVDKRYHAVVSAPVFPDDVQAFAQGIRFADGTVCLPAGLRVLQPGSTPLVEVCIREGKYHQVKRMFLATQKKVLSLRRVAVGNLMLDPSLGPGECRELEEKELQMALGLQNI